ncbi:MAG: helical backbone metal receptor [Thermaurantimonas sp.]
MRVVSLVPSLTELLYHLQANVVGITKFCVHPDIWYRTLPRVSGTKNPDLKRIQTLQPDLIIANYEENRREDVEALQQITNVLITNIVTLEDAMNEIIRIGRACKAETSAIQLSKTIDVLWKPLKNSARNLRVVYLIWRKPYMAAGTDTFIHHVITHIGLKNAVQTARYPKLHAEEIRTLRPDVLFLSSEPYPFKEKHIEELNQYVPDSHIVLVNGEAFSWYGYRMIPSSVYLSSLITHLNHL